MGTQTVVSLIAIGLVIVVAGGLVAYILASNLMGTGNVSERLSAYAGTPDAAVARGPNRNRARLTRARNRLNAMLSPFASQEMAVMLITANWPITETEYMLIRIGGAILSLLIGWLVFGSIISGAGLAILAFMVPGLLLQRALIVRRMAFERQLVDVLVLLTNSTRAGYSLLQAIDVVVNEMDAPAAEEFRRVRREVSLGLPLNQALENLNLRIQNADLAMVVTAININSQVGGNLVTMLESVTKTIRERVRLFAEVRVLTSQQRMNSMILTFLPIGMGALVMFLNPEYMKPIFQPGPYLCFPIGSIVSVILGNIIVRRLTKIEV